MDRGPSDKLSNVAQEAKKFSSVVQRRLFEFKRRYKSGLRQFGLSFAVTATAFATPALAQEDGMSGAESVMCGAGGGPNLGRIIMIVLALFAMLFVIKAVFEGMAAMDKMNSPREQEHLEGRDGIKSAGTTLMAAFIPLLAGPFLEIIGIDTVSCIDWSLGIMMALPF